MTTGLTPDAELQALKDLVVSDGWQVLQAHLETAWGSDACLAAIDQALLRAAPEDELAITKRIRDTFKGVRAEASWVTQRVSELETGLKHKPVSIVDRFLQHRRVPR
jgi:hypothetical protein